MIISGQPVSSPHCSFLSSRSVSWSPASLTQFWNVLLSDVIIPVAPGPWHDFLSFTDFTWFFLSFPALLDVSLNKCALEESWIAMGLHKSYLISLCRCKFDPLGCRRWLGLIWGFICRWMGCRAFRWALLLLWCHKYLILLIFGKLDHQGDDKKGISAQPEK